MHFGTIASGSSGNCLYAGNKDYHILIDAGISAKRVINGLEAFNIKPEQLNGILITHEHIDHIAGIGVLLRKHHIPVYATLGTIEKIKSTKSLGNMPESAFHPINTHEPFEIGNIEIKAFPISHDASEPVSYTLKNDNKKIGMVTDLGYYDDSIVEQLYQSNILYVEANHDIRMLQVGPYPYYLKQRILGNRGHLCNEMAGKLVNDLAHEQLEKIILGHLSKENNYPDLALETVKQESGIEHNKHTHIGAQDIFVAPRDTVSDLINL